MVVLLHNYHAGPAVVLGELPLVPASVAVFVLLHKLCWVVRVNHKIVWCSKCRIQKGDVDVVPLVCVQDDLALEASLRVLAEANYFVVHYHLVQVLGLHPVCQCLQIA